MKLIHKILLGLVVAGASVGALYIKNTGENIQSLLLAAGAHEDCVTDDHTALQAVLDGLPAGQIAKFPPGVCFALTSGISIKSAVIGVDFNGSTLSATGMTSGYALSITPKLTSPFNRYTAQLPIRNFILVGPASESNVTDGLFIGGSGTGNISGQTVADFHIRGFRDDVYIGDYAYINDFWNGNVEAASRYGLNYVATTTSGEAINWHGGRFADSHKSDNSAIAINMANSDGGNNELFLFGTSLDYNDKQCSINAGVLNMVSVHIEDNHFANSLCDIVWNTSDQPAGVFMFGGHVGVTESAANSRTSLFTISGTKAFIVAKTLWNTFDHSSQLVTVVSGTPHIDLTGSEFDYAGSTKFPTLPATYNRAYNGGAETGNLDGWSNSGTSYTFTNDGSVFHSGAHSFKMVSSGTSNGSIRTYAEVHPGQRIVWHAWASVEALSAGQVFFETRIYNANPDATTVFQVDSADTGSWSAPTAGFVELRRTTIAPAGSRYAYMNLSGVGFTGTAYLDDAEIDVF